MKRTNIGPLAMLELTPRERIEVLYELYPQERTFLVDVAYHLASGYVIDREDAFLMGRPVVMDAPEEAILCPHVSFNRWSADAWFIWAFSGPLHLMHELAPYPLEFVGWKRRAGRVRWYRCDRALHKVDAVVSFH